MNTFYDKLDALYQSGDKSAAEEHIKDYLYNLQASDQESSPEYAAVLNELAGFYRGVSRYDESAERFNKALDILKASGMNPSPQ